jgi:hypothetical protein
MKFIFATAILAAALNFGSNAQAQANTEPTKPSAVVANWDKCGTDCRRNVMSPACPSDDQASFLSNAQVAGFKTQRDMFDAVRAGCNTKVTQQTSPTVLPRAKPATLGLKPGEYAQNSKIYAEFVANCQAAKGDTPTLKDEAAHLMEVLYKTNRPQYDLQIKGCQMALTVPKAQPKAEPKQTVMAQAAYIGANAEVEVGVRAPGYQARPNVYRPGIGLNRGQYRSFENVAADSLHVHTKTGKDYDLGNVRPGQKVCLPPQHLHRSERCTAIAGGGINCKFDCY